MKGYLNTLIGMLGAGLTIVFGELSPMLVALCVAMLIDYVSGMVVALVFKNSPKTDSGKASSEICIRGLVKKLFMLVLVAMGNRLDLALNVDFVKMGMPMLLNQKTRIFMLELDFTQKVYTNLMII